MTSDRTILTLVATAGLVGNPAVAASAAGNCGPTKKPALTDSSLSLAHKACLEKFGESAVSGDWQLIAASPKAKQVWLHATSGKVVQIAMPKPGDMNISVIRPGKAEKTPSISEMANAGLIKFARPIVMSP